jgi:hypothetical protein
MSDDTTSKKRSLTEFISNNNCLEESHVGPSKKQKGSVSKDSINVDEKLTGLSKQIDTSICNIKGSMDDTIKGQKLAGMPKKIIFNS